MKATPWIVTVVGIVLVAALAVWIGAAWTSGVAVDSSEVARGPIREFVDERAITRLPETYLITMPYSARIEPITLSEGDPVEADNPRRPVARLVADDLRLAGDEAQAAVERLDAAIAENLDTKMEQLAEKQAQQLVASMADTVAAAAERVRSGEAKYDYAKKNMERTKRLLDSEVATEDDWDRAQLQRITSEVDLAQDRLVHSITAALKLATDIVPTMIRQSVTDKRLTDAVLKKQRAEAAAALERVKLRQRRGIIQSPVDGVVLKRFVSNERFLAAGDPLLEIGRLQDLQVEADVLSLDVVNAKVGDAVEIYGPAIGPRDARGTISKIYPAGFTKISSLGVEQQRVTVVVRIDPQDLRRLRDQRGLGVGYRVRARIITAEKPDALLVPRSALFRSPQGKWQLYKIEDGRARLQEVEIGMLNDTQAEVLAGIHEGDRIVHTPDSNLADGKRVKTD